jgi:uncharacterized DUF497 family protein
VRFVWDERKGARNLSEHGLDFADAEALFDFDEAVITPTYPGSDGRARFKAIGYLGRRLVVLVFSTLGTEAVSLISLRPSSRRERKLYEED